ncbi:MAG: protease complex subunit PrcB family protein [Gammaproteobacteria bacterium]|jgi:hypothetical protein
MRNLILFCALALTLLTGCNEEPTSSKTKEPANVNFVVITTGINSGIQSEMTSIYKLDTQQSFDEFWAQHNKDLQPPTEKPAIDFNKEMVVAVVDANQPSSGYLIGIDQLQEVDGKLYIFATRKQPGAGCVNLGVISQPFTLIKLPKLDLVPELRLSTQTVDCQ